MQRSTLATWAYLVGWTVGSQGCGGIPSAVPKTVELQRPDGGRLAYYHWPADGPSLILIPGSWSEYTQFDAIRSHLDSNINLVVVELPGHGRSWPPAHPASIESFAENVLRVVDDLRWTRWYAGGHSIGGMIAIELAAHRPEELAGVIALEGWTHHTAEKEAFGGASYHTLSKAQEKARQAERNRTLSRLTEEQTAYFRTIWRRWDGGPILRSTAVRVLEVWGDRKLPRPSRDAMKIPARDNIQLHWVAGSSHTLPMEAPQEVAAAINRFIDSE